MIVVKRGQLLPIVFCYYAFMSYLQNYEDKT